MTRHDDLPLFAHRERDIERLAPIARELADRAGEHGIIFADVRIVAVQRGYLTGEEQGRKLSFGAAVMRAAGLVPTAEHRRSHVPKSHGNLQVVWRSPAYSRQGAA